MSFIEDACPFEATGRARQCQSCCGASQPVPPCVAAYLGRGRRQHGENVVPIRRADAAGARRAA